MPRTLIENGNSQSSITLPLPYQFVLPPGDSVVVADDKPTVIANLGGGSAIQRIGLRLKALPTSESPTVALPDPSYQTVQGGGAPTTKRSTLDFEGAGVTVTDDAANSRTQVTIAVSAAQDQETYGCAAGLAVLTAVYLSAADTVDVADNTSGTNKSPSIGIVISKPTPTSCIVRYQGDVVGFVGLVPGATYYLSAAGAVVTPAPVGPAGTVVQKLGFARNATTLVVELDRDREFL